MQAPPITRRDLERRHAALADLRRYLDGQEHEFNERRRHVQAFAERYLSRLGPLYKELGALDAQLHRTTQDLIGMLRERGLLLAPPPHEAPRSTLPQAREPSAGHQARFEGLPPPAPLPPVPIGADIAQWAPPTLKMLYRRAAMRIHPDRAGPDERLRAAREQMMMKLNAAYAAGERWRIEAMLLAAGEAPAQVTGGNAEALRNWLAHCEQLVQARLRLVNDARAALATQAMHKLWQSVSQAEARGLDPLQLKAAELGRQIDERRKELYIGQRLKPESNLTRAFLHRQGVIAPAQVQGGVAAQASN